MSKSWWPYWVALIALCVAVGANALVGLHSTARVAEAHQWVSHTYEVRAALETLLSLNKEARTDQRAFLLTGDTTYLESYEGAVAGLDAKLGRVGFLVQDNPTQQAALAELGRLITERRKEFDQAIHQRRNQGQAAPATQLIPSGAGDGSDALNAFVAQMENEESRLLTLRLETAEQSRRNANQAILAGAALSLVLIGGVGYLVVHNLRIRHENERRIAEQKDWLRVTLASIGDAVLTTDVHGRVTSLNAVAEELTGWTEADAVGRDLREIFVIVNETNRKSVENPALRALTGGTVVGLANHTVLIARNGTERPIDDSAAPIRGANGAVGGAVLVFRDITARKASQHELEEANRRKDEFMAMLSHELRNPLAPITTALALLRRRHVAAPELAIIQRQVTHLVRLVDDLLDVSRITRGKIEIKRESVELSLVVDRAIEIASPLLEGRRQRVTIDVAQSGLLLDADPGRLAQAIANLLTNASKFSTSGAGIKVDGSASAEWVRLVVTDEGQGIAPDMLERIFDSFTQTRQGLDRSEGGLGLGLTIARSLVELHGGTLRASSAGVGKGSSFILELPQSSSAFAARLKAPAAAMASTAPPAAGTDTSVLIVDDNEDALTMLAAVLSDAGYLVDLALDGDSALARARDSIPKAAIVDIGLPGMNGYELAKRLRALQAPSQPILLIALSGYGQSEDKARAMAAGFDSHLTKPVEPEMLLITLSKGTRQSQ